MPIFAKYSLSLEVKSGTKGSMQSMRLFLHEKNLGFGIRASLENFGKLDDTPLNKANNGGDRPASWQQFRCEILRANIALIYIRKIFLKIIA